jgi:hypothetical protein
MLNPNIDNQAKTPNTTMTLSPFLANKMAEFIEYRVAMLNSTNDTTQ